MTPSELDLIVRDRVDRDDRKLGRLSREDWAELERIGRQAMEQEAAERRKA